MIPPKTYKNKSLETALNGFIYVYNTKHSNNFSFMLHNRSNQSMCKKVLNILLENKEHYDYW